MEDEENAAWQTRSDDSSTTITGCAGDECVSRWCRRCNGRILLPRRPIMEDEEESLREQENDDDDDN